MRVTFYNIEQRNRNGKSWGLFYYGLSSLADAREAARDYSSTPCQPMRVVECSVVEVMESVKH